MAGKHTQRDILTMVMPQTAKRSVGLLLLCLLLVGCSAFQPREEVLSLPPYAVGENETLIERFAPVIVPAGAQSYNRIGKAAARLDEAGREEIYIDPDTAVFYYRQSSFTTSKGRYTNLYYRFHFEGVPYSLIPFHLTAGNNGGLYIVLTLNARQEPVLITTVHTCGCYLAIIPTQHLPVDAYPDNWDTEQQRIYGEILPGVVRFKRGGRPFIALRDATHRVMDVRIDRLDTTQDSFQQVILMPETALYRLPLGNNTTSFFHHEGINKGYVKNATKPWERFLMSWWALDWNIGMDKELGPVEKTGVRFFTSLKPWARKQSDMVDFKTFLHYWGWKL